jgi:hypothetical protein
VQATPRVFATLDLGSATAATALIGRVDRRWRLLGALSAPATASPDRILELLAERVASADPGLADSVGLVPEAAADLPRVAVRTGRPGMLAVVAASERALAGLVSPVTRSGWQWSGQSAERHDAEAMTALLLRPEVTAVLVAIGDPPGGDERGAVRLLTALTAAAAARRPELSVVLAGAAAREGSSFSGRQPEGAPDQTPGTPGAPGSLGDAGPPVNTNAGTRGQSGALGRLVLAPAPTASSAGWLGLIEVLADLRRDDEDSRQAITRAVAGLAGALDRRVELVELGMDGGLRATAAPGRSGDGSTVVAVAAAEAALVPPQLDEDRLDRILGWSTLPLDRHRLRDRLQELRAAPWAGIGGEGERLRLGAARAALAVLVELSPDIDAMRPPDLVVLAGGVFGPMPAPAALLAVADVLRRAGAYQVALDHARLLGPLGSLEDPAERDRLIADLAGDLLVPLGSVVMPAGIRAGRRPGRLFVESARGRRELPLTPGAVARLDIPPGEQATVLLEARESVRLGSLGRRLSVDVAGGTGGLLVDLRDVPLQLPERRDPRRELLLHWQETAGSVVES